MTIVAAEVIEGDYLLLNFTGDLLLQGGDKLINYCDNQTVRHNTINAQRYFSGQISGVGLMKITFSI